jgi:hypothetical protein
MTDLVNKPPHYNAGGVECIKAIEASMSPGEFKGYLKGNAMKYLWRYNLKGSAVQDLEKCIWYVTRLKEVVERETRPMVTGETRTVYGHTGDS